MSQQLVQPKSSYIIPGSVEVAKDNPNKRFFKVFLLNNAITRTIDKFGSRFKIENLDVLDRDIDTFIGRPLIPFNDKKAGKHVSPKDVGIYQHRYATKLEYINAANKFYDDYGKAKIVDIFKPDRDLLNAARNNPDKVLDYDGLCATEDPGLVSQLDHYSKNTNPNDWIYVSPGLVSIDSYYTKDGVKVVKQFAATHTHIVDEPAFTEPVAYIHKKTCNMDHKTCYFDLLTASEEKDLFNNVQDKKNMSSNNTGDQGAGLSQIGEDLTNAQNLNNNDQNGIKSKTQISDSKGNVQETIERNDDSQTKKKETKKVEKKADDDKEVEKIEKTEKTEKVEKVEEDKEAPLTASQLKKILADEREATLQAVREEQNQKLEEQNKTNVLSKYIDNKNEELKESYDFYHQLPINSDQLARILEDSKFNTQLQKNGKRAVELTASAYTGVRTSRNANPSKVNDSNKTGRSDSEIHGDNTRGMLGKYR